MRHDNRAAFEEWAELKTVLPLRGRDWKNRDQISGVYLNWEVEAYWIGWIGGWRAAWDTATKLDKGVWPLKGGKWVNGSDPLNYPLNCVDNE